MGPRAELRTVRAYINEQWVSFEFKNLRKGMKFMLFEGDGEQVGGTWVAKSDAYTNDDGIGEIQCDACDEDQHVEL